MEKYKIKNLGTIISGGTPSTSNENYWDGNIIWITPKDLSKNKCKYIYTGERNISKDGLEHSSAKLLPKNAVLLSSRAPIGYLALAGCELTTNQGFKSIVCNESIILSEYLYYLLSTKIDDLISISSGSTFLELSKSAFENLELNIHNINEQQHIVDTIGSIDDLIEHKLLLLDKLEQLEKNLYLKECLNKDKFSLLDRLQFIKGKKPKNFTDNGIDYLTIDALENGNLTYTNDEKLVYCKTNDILMVMDGASSGKVYIGYNGVVGSTLAKIKTNINPYYLYIYLKNNYKNIREHNIGSAIPHTNKDIIYTLKISNNTISNEIYNFLLNTRINLNIEIIHLKSLKTSYLKKFFG